MTTTTTTTTTNLSKDPSSSSPFLSPSSIQLRTAIPGPKSQALMQERLKEVARGPFHVTPIFAHKAHGAIIEDVDGNHFIDFAAGIGVVNTGHLNHAVTSAIAAQLEHSLHLSFNVTPYESYVQLCKLLNQKTPGDFPKKTFLANSGAEAVENAIKIARAYTGKQAIIAFEHGFHGRTYMAMSLTSKGLYRQGFGPYNSEVYSTPFPYTYRWPSGSDSERVVRECFAEFENLVKIRLLPSHVAAVIFEPVQGEGGFLTMPREFLQKLRAFCTEHKIVLIADEIQSGFGRTGTLFACEQMGIAPDLMTTAKGLAGGMPISAVTGRAEIMDSAAEGAIGGTFGGHPLSCAAALAVFEQFEKTDLLDRSCELGRVLNAKMHDWQERFACVGDVRGLGPMLAMEMVVDKTSKTPNAPAAKKLVKYCYEHGVILMSAGSYGNAIRFLMPLMIGKDELAAGLEVVENGLKEISI
jgi:4-aminobutyrate aminotransferase/(S)-3-amino-2-methylpropionate transaminase